MQAYILFISPALFLITAEFFFTLNEYKRDYKLKFLLNFLLFLLIALPIRYMIERVKPFENSNRNPDWVTNLRKLNDRKIPNGVLFNYDKPIEAMFYTNFTAYQNIPDKNRITDLITKGNVIIINDDGKIPDDIKTIKGITIQKF